MVAVDLSSQRERDGAERETSISSLAGDIAWLIYELGLYAPVVVGHGLGGMVAIELGARHPDLPSAIIALHPLGPWQVETPPSGHVDEWDSAAALAACSVPVLYVVAREGAGPFIRLKNPDHVNALIDAFLARHGKDEKAGRAPVGRPDGQLKPSPRVRNLQRLL